MGRIIARDLAGTVPAGTTVVLADADLALARRVARVTAATRQGVRVRSVQADVRDAPRTAKLLRQLQTFAVINACHHHLNLFVMEAALAAAAHYCDLGGLFHYTRRQLRLDRAWKKADRLALLGIGAAPGIVNVLARAGAEDLDEVREIHVSVAGTDPGSGPGTAPLSASYSIQTILEEASEPAAVFTNGRLRFVPPMSGAGQIAFPPPVGTQRPAFTLHSEVATLPRSFRAKGIRECTFRIAFPQELADKLRFLRALGLLSTRPVAIGEQSAVPRELLLALLRRIPAPQPSGSNSGQYEILRVVVRGASHGVLLERTLECHTDGMPAWGVGTDIDTGSPPSVAMQMLARGEITARGCVPPEVAIPPEPFFKELERRRMVIRRSERRGRWQ
jgi:saccharopine dehydrogenase-like NADP-dependent oxidoreductase